MKKDARRWASPGDVSEEKRKAGGSVGDIPRWPPIIARGWPIKPKPAAPSGRA
ncbi:MAG: hypothetical protein AAFR58_18460 [Cyanobacteria bacterium J06627_28]